MNKIDVSKCELVDCWFYIDHTPPKGQGNWCGAIHKGACKLNSTDCKDTPIERCLIKSLYKQLQQLKAENEELKKDNSTLKDILSYPKYTNENAYNELLKLSKAELIKDLIESHQHGESTSQVVYRRISEENKKYKQCLDEIEDILNIYFDDDWKATREIEKLIQQVKEGE